MRFTPVDASIDLRHACEKWRPGTGSGALGVFRDALPQMAEMVENWAASFYAIMHNAHADLMRTLDINFVHVTAEIYKLLWKAAQLGLELPNQFDNIHADYVSRRATAGAHTSNVGAGTAAG